MGKRKIDEEQIELYAELMQTVVGDVKVICEDGETTLIKSIMVVRSGVFSRMMDGSFRESNTNIVSLPGKRLVVVKALLDYLQWNLLPAVTSVEDLVDIYATAHEYMVDPLKVVVADMLTSMINREHAATVYEKCSMCELSHIKDKARVYITTRIFGLDKCITCNICSLSIESVKCAGKNNSCGWKLTAVLSGGICPECRGDVDKQISSFAHDDPMTKLKCGGKLAFRVERFISLEGVKESTIVELMHHVCK